MSKFIIGDELKNQTKVDEVNLPVTIKEVKIESLIQAQLEYTGKVSGRQYVWNRAGDIVSVEESDVPELLDKRLGKKTCCGNGENRIFQIAS